MKVLIILKMSDESDCKYESLVKNVNYFVREVLYSAQHDGSWTIDCVRRGLGWALYCEKAIQQPSMSCALSSYLDTQPFNVNVTIRDVQNLRKCLLSNLFLNQLLPKETVESLVDIAQKEIGDIETQNLLEISHQKVKNYHELVGEMRQKPLESVYNIFKVRLLIEATKISSSTLSPLNQLFQTSGSLYQLLLVSNQLSKNESEKLMAILGEWLAEELSKPPSSCYFIFQEIAMLPIEQLALLCRKYPGLQMKLLTLVKTYGTSLCNSKTDQIDLDRSSCRSSLVAICQSFMSFPDLASVTKTAFSAWCITIDAYFWHKLFLEIQKEELL